MRHRRLSWLLVLVMLWGGTALFIFPCSSTETELPFAQRLQDALDSGRLTADVMGVSAAIIVPGYEIWLGVSGMSDPTTSESIKPGMLFDIASIGKMYLASLVLKLVEERHLTLEDPLHKWLPDYPNIDSTITIRQLLNHTSGVFDLVEHPQSPFRIPFTSIDFTKVWTPEEVLTTLVNEPYFPPGTGWHYSTTGYILLKMIVEKITQSKVSTELRNRFLDPLDLNSTVVLDSEEPIPANLDVAHAWRIAGRDSDGNLIREDISSRPITWWTSMSPDLIYATAEDLARWSQALNQGKVVSQASLDQMLTFHSPTPGEPLVFGYGLGVMEFPPEILGGMLGRADVSMWGHLGSQYGYRAFVGHLPEHSVSISVLINDDTDEGITYISIALLKVLLSHLEVIS